MKAVFFDRDGIVNLSPPESGYVLSLDDFHIMPEFPDVLRAVTELQYGAVVITNQRCIERGLVTRETVEAMHAHLRESLLRDHGLELLDVLYCPHGPEDHCLCRKPLPGMLLEAMRRHAIDPEVSWMIGDRMTDVEAGKRAGCRAILVNPDDGIIDPDGLYLPDRVCPDMRSLRRDINQWL